tara:strand:- start:533 stop:691 length:159 start_codon:yes stop_codon:yes gene_type:complete
MKLVVISNEKLFNKFFLNVPVSNKYLNILIHFIFSLFAEIIIALINKKIINN